MVTLRSVTHSKLSSFLLISSGKSLNFVAFENRIGPVGCAGEILARTRKR